MMLVAMLVIAVAAVVVVVIVVVVVVAAAIQQGEVRVVPQSPRWLRTFSGMRLALIAHADLFTQRQQSIIYRLILLLLASRTQLRLRSRELVF